MSKEVKYNGLKIVSLDKKLVEHTFRKAARRLYKTKNIIIIAEYDEDRISKGECIRYGISTYRDNVDTEAAINAYLANLKLNARN